MTAQSARGRGTEQRHRAFSRSAVPASILLLFGLTARPAQADISGFVLEANSGSPGTPVAGARVHVQADPTGPVVTSGADGSFTLPVSPAGPVVVTAAVTYDAAAAVNYTTAGTLAFDGDTGVEIRLRGLPAADNPGYVPAEASSCGGCHIDQFDQWQTSNHSFAAQDVWVLDLFSGTGTPGGGAGYVFRDLHDPGETGFCATCHAPLADVFNPGNVMLDEVVGSSALEGVNCVACHQIDQVSTAVNALHLLGNATYRFPDSPFFGTEQFVWGPLDDISFVGMSASHAPIFAESRFCASCHQYANPDTGAPGQNTYLEWLASPFAQPGPGFRSCQDCHMPAAAEPGTICALGSSPERVAAQRHAHSFVGSTPQTLAAAIQLDLGAFDAAGRLRVRAEVTNAGAGHAFPTGVSIRNALVVVSATLRGQPLPQVAGPTVPFWADDHVPGNQPGDYAGEPGKGFAKILEGRINGEGPVVRPVLFIDAEGVDSDTLIPPGATDVTEVELLLPPDAQPGEIVEVTARLLYRRAFRALAVTKGWIETPQGGPVEIEVASRQLEVSLIGGGPVAIPTLGSWGLLLLAAILAAAGWWRLRG